MCLLLHFKVHKIATQNIWNLSSTINLTDIVNVNCCSHAEYGIKKLFSNNKITKKIVIH